MSAWISVKDRLPTAENKGKMLACTNDGWVFRPGGGADGRGRDRRQPGRDRLVDAVSEATGGVQGDEPMIWKIVFTLCCGFFGWMIGMTFANTSRILRILEEVKK